MQARRVEAEARPLSDLDIDVWIDVGDALAGDDQLAGLKAGRVVLRVLGLDASGVDREVHKQIGPIFNGRRHRFEASPTRLSLRG